MSLVWGERFEIHDDVYVGPDNINIGKGVFAAVDIPKGDILFDFSWAEVEAPGVHGVPEHSQKIMLMYDQSIEGVLGHDDFYIATHECRPLNLGHPANHAVSQVYECGTTFQDHKCGW